jgi:hypothetical protein
MYIVNISFCVLTNPENVLFFLYFKLNTYSQFKIKLLITFFVFLLGQNYDRNTKRDRGKEE